MKNIGICTKFIVATLISCFMSVNISAAQSVLTGNFESGSGLGKFVYGDNSSGLSIDYYASSINKKLTYVVAKYDECSSMAMYKIPHTRQVAIDGSCSSQGGQIYQYVYEWKPSYSNWCLIREITGKKADITSGTVVPSEQVARVMNCFAIGVTGSYKYESSAQSAEDISEELRKFRVSAGNKPKLKEYLNSIPSYSVSELVSYITAGNVGDINDLAFYLSENGRTYDAIPILQEIAKKFPDRIVAKLNLADAYWDNGFKGQASPFYQEYFDKMIARGLGSRVPNRVIERTKK